MFVDLPTFVFDGDKRTTVCLLGMPSCSNGSLWIVFTLLSYDLISICFKKWLLFCVSLNKKIEVSTDASALNMLSIFYILGKQ